MQTHTRHQPKDDDDNDQVSFVPFKSNIITPVRVKGKSCGAMKTIFSRMLERNASRLPVAGRHWSLCGTGSLVADDKAKTSVAGRPGSSRCLSASPSSWSSLMSNEKYDSKSTNSRPSWTEEWKELGLGCTLVDKSESTAMTNLFFVQVGFGVDQHGDANATKAAIRAVRNAIEFNSIPGVVEAIPGGRKEMLIQVKLGIPPVKPDDSGEGRIDSSPLEPLPVNPLEVAKVFPYGRLLPIKTVVGGLSFSTGRLVPELGDEDDEAICVAACVTIGYNKPDSQENTTTTTTTTTGTSTTHTVYSTRDGL